MLKAGVRLRGPRWKMKAPLGLVAGLVVGRVSGLVCGLVMGAGGLPGGCGRAGVLNAPTPT